jgi:hypothetical protein
MGKSGPTNIQCHGGGNSAKVSIARKTKANMNGGLRYVHLGDMGTLIKKALLSKQLAEFLSAQSSVLCDPAHRKRLNWIVARNRDLPGSITHHNVLTLANCRESRLFQSPYRVQMIDSDNLGHG